MFIQETDTYAVSIESDSLNRGAAEQRKSSLTRTRSYDEILIESDVKVTKTTTSSD